MITSSRQTIALDFTSRIFLLLIAVGIPINLLSNARYDNAWTVGEWLISYAGGFVRRGLPGFVIDILATTRGISPIFAIWSACLLAYAFLSFLIWWLCRGKFDTILLLSPMILLGPIIGDYFVRKDVLLLALYGTCLGSIYWLTVKKFTRPQSILLINILCIVAVLTHESYGFWGLPSISLALFVATHNSERIRVISWLRSLHLLAPSIFVFLLCIACKGSPEQALKIHSSWQSIATLIPSTNALFANKPIGAIDAIGWTTIKGVSLSYSTLNDIDLLIWIPAAWALTIYVCINLFTGKECGHKASWKRIIVLFQFAAISPLFILGWDYGRWIFLWMGSSALLYGLTTLIVDLGEVKILSPKAEIALQKMAPGISLDGPARIALLMLGIPACCWSVKNFLLSTPIGYFLTMLKKFI